MDFKPYRKLFPITESYTFFNHAAVSAPPTPVTEAVHNLLTLIQTRAFDHVRDQVLGVTDEFKANVAKLINAARADEIVPMGNTASGINTAVNSLPLKAGDNILVLEGDYPAVIYPCLNLAPKGILTKWVPQKNGGLDLDVLSARIDNRTRAIVLSTAMFATGYKNDIAAVGCICRERGIYFVVDGIQTLGAFPMDVQACNIDFLVAGSQKWLMSIMGTGFLYCRHEILNDLQMGAYVGTMSMADPMNYLDYNFTFQDSSERFNLGTPNLPGVAGLNASVKMFLDIGMQNIAPRILELTGAVIDDLQGRGYNIISNLQPEHRSGIVIVEVADPQAAYEKLLANNVVTSVRGAGLRIAPHFYNTPEEMRRVGEVLGNR